MKEGVRVPKVYCHLNEVSMFPLADMFLGRTQIRHSKPLIFKLYDASEGVKVVPKYIFISYRGVGNRPTKRESFVSQLTMIKN